MALGAELVGAWAAALGQRGRAPDRIARVEGGREWVALQCWRAKDWLFLSWNADVPGLCRMPALRMADLKSAAEPPCPLVLALRAHVSGAYFVRAEHKGHDRVLEIFFERPIGAGICRGRSLVLECAGRYSNLILQDENGDIIDVAKHVHPDMNRYRSLLPGHPYTPPPPLGGFSPEDDGWIDTAPASLSRLIGFGRPLLTHVARHWQSFPRDAWIQAFRETFSSPAQGMLQMLDHGYLTRFTLPLPKGSPLPDQDLLIFSQKLSADFLKDRILQAGLRVLRQEGETVAHRLAREEEGFAHKEQLFRQSDQRKLWGDLLLSHAALVEEALHDRQSSVVLVPWEENAPPETIPLNPDRNVAANAQQCYQAYRKWKAYGQALDRERRTLEARRHDVEEQMAVLDAVEDIQVLRSLLEASRPGSSKKRRPAPPHLRYALNGGTAYVGLNAPGNRYVTFEIASGDDLWFHAQNVPGAHVILKIDEESRRDDLVLSAASLAAAYSRAKGSLAVAVDVTERRQVRHVPGQGVAFVTYHRFRTVRISPSYWRDQPHVMAEKTQG